MALPVTEVEEEVLNFKKKFEELVTYLDLVHGCYKAISKDIVRMYQSDRTVSNEINGDTRGGVSPLICY